MQTKNKPWLSSWPNNVPQKLKYPKVPLHEILEKTAKEHPEKVAIAYFEREITYADLDSLSNQFAGALVALGVKKGDRVAIFLPNNPQFLITYYGILKAGAVLTAISPLHKEREVAYQLNDAEAETIVALDSLYPIVEKVWRKTLLKNAVVTSLEEYASKASVSSTKKEKAPNVYQFQELLKEATTPLRMSINPEVDLAAL